MNTVTQSTEQTASKVVRIPEDIWEIVRTKAFNDRTTIAAVVEELLRFALKRRAGAA